MVMKKPIARQITVRFIDPSWRDQDTSKQEIGHREDAEYPVQDREDVFVHKCHKDGDYIIVRQINLFISLDFFIYSL